MNSGEPSRRSQGDLLSDMILGGQDGLVNVLGLTLGLSAASHDVRIVIAGGLAATFAESISMAAVALTSKTAERDHYEAELEREHREIKEAPEKEEAEIRQIYENKGFHGQILDDIVKHVISSEELWVDQMMKEELKLQEIKQKEIYLKSFVVGISSLVGSIFPLVAYFFLPIKSALIISIIISALALFLIGVYKAKVTIGKPTKSGIQMLLIGLGAALAGYLIGLIFGSKGM